jgi:long-chain acyl-CoA synthetase
MPLSAGASVTYLEERTPELLARAFRETPPTSMVGVPAVWEALHRKIDGQLNDLIKPAELLVRLLMRGNRWLRDHSPWNVGRWVFSPMHDALGGRLRMMVSGGAPLNPRIFDDFRGYGFSLYEGYGLTEASPVITVGWPRERTPAGSVGWPLPGLDVRIHEPDEQGIGQVIARGPTIMAGYLEDPEATKEVVKDGWLHTGDQGRLDEKGRLFIVGRQKDVIIDTGGKNVYPDEIEDLYRVSPFLKELSVVGIPAEQGTGERVAALVVPSYEADEAKDLSKEDVRERLRDHFREVGSKQPLARRIKVLHFWETELPRTATRKVKRSLVREEIIRLESQLKKARGAAEDGIDNATTTVSRLVAAISQRNPGEIGLGDHLVDHLGFDSLMQMELLTAIEEEFPKARVSQEEMLAIDTVGDIVRLVARDRSSESRKKTEVGDTEEAPIPVPALVRVLGKNMLGLAQRLAHERLLDIEVEGQGNIPANTNFIVAANHTSHLDMGLVKHALGDLAGELMSVAAKDYFFDDRIRRLYFENFTNLLPMDRHGSLKKSLRLAGEALRQGSSLLIFPEGTRSRDGVMSDFKPAVGYLCLHENVDILPIALIGTHDALPVGAALPKGRKLGARIGPPIRAEDMQRETEHMSRAAAYRHVANVAERAVRRMLGENQRALVIDVEASSGKQNGANGINAHLDETSETPVRIPAVLLDHEGSS